MTAARTRVRRTRSDTTPPAATRTRAARRRPQAPSPSTGSGARRRRSRKVGAAVLGACLLASACTGTTGGQVRARETKQKRRAASTTTTAAPDCAQTLPPAGQAAQLLMVLVTGPDAATAALANGSVGGFALKGNQSRDVGTQVATAVKEAPVPPLVASDEEGGTVQRLRLALGNLPAAATAAKGTPEDAAKAAGTHAAGMKRLGFTMNFAPVADVGSGSGLGTRSYGSDPSTVSDFVDAVFPAIRGAGVIPVLKHWPGIGGGSDDPHQKLTKLADISTLRTKDLLPFDRAIAKGAPAIMVAHAEVPGLTQKGEPASLSSAAITGELRGREGFEGLVITDSLGMGAISPLGSQAEAAEKAIAAGADVALVSGSDVVGAAHDRLVEAITSGRIPTEQVVASVRRVLAAKGIDGACLDAVARYSALARPTTTIQGSTSVPGSPAGTTGGSSGSTGGTGSGSSGSTSTTVAGATTTTTGRTTVSTGPVDRGING